MPVTEPGPSEGVEGAGIEWEPAEADLELAREAALEAGEVIRRARGTSVPVRYKSADQPVTDVDLEANEILRRALTARRPGYGWLSEETFEAPDPDTDSVWVVDPLDGTANFVAGRPEFAICIGLVRRGTSVLGLVYNPVQRDVYYAMEGRGAFRNGERIRTRAAGGEAPRLVASAGELKRSLLDVVPPDWPVERLGSTALKTMRVAEGGADLYLSRSPKGVWDLVAPLLIACEAGATAWQLDGQPLSIFGLQAQKGLIVAGPAGLAGVPRLVHLLARDAAGTADR